VPSVSARIRREVITKPSAARAGHNVGDYARARASLTWEDARRALDGLPGGRGINIAHEAVDRHAAGGRAAHVALRCHGRDGAVTDLGSPGPGPRGS
jgi:acetyl-CoA synthetase